MEPENIYNTVINKYPTNRDVKIKGPSQWLQSRRIDDGAEGLWRVHDKLYDLKDFINKHPGGRTWLLLTKGTDVTEAFESTHLSLKPKATLENYYIRDAASPRNYRFTFDENGFYQTLKRKVMKKLSSIDKSVANKSKIYFDIVLFLCFTLSILSLRFENFYIKGALVVLSGLFMSLVVTISHNFVHQRDNLRMYFSGIALHNFRDWKVFHVLSHHLYPNSFADLQVLLYEPRFKWIPILPKTRLEIVLSTLGSPFEYCLGSFNTFFGRFYETICLKKKMFGWDELLDLSVPALMFIFGGKPLSFALLCEIVILWWSILVVNGFFYAVNGINTGHHSPKLVHEGDEFRSLDFGLYQLSTTVDRVEANSNLFTSLALFGEHTLHHLFPVLDHAILPHLQKEFLETCQEFEIEIRKFTLIESVFEQYKQLARTKVTKLK